MKTFQLTILELEYILTQAKSMKETDASLSNTIEFQIEASSDLHTGNDKGCAVLKSGYSECNNKAITYFE